MGYAVYKNKDIAESKPTVNFNFNLVYDLPKITKLSPSEKFTKKIDTQINYVVNYAEPSEYGSAFINDTLSNMHYELQGINNRVDYANKKLDACIPVGIVYGVIPLDLGNNTTLKPDDLFGHGKSVTSMSFEVAESSTNGNKYEMTVGSALKADALVGQLIPGLGLSFEYNYNTSTETKHSLTTKNKVTFSPKQTNDWDTGFLYCQIPDIKYASYQIDGNGEQPLYYPNTLIEDPQLLIFYTYDFSPVTYSFHLTDPTKIWDGSKWMESDLLEGMFATPTTTDIDGWENATFQDEWRDISGVLVFSDDYETGQQSDGTVSLGESTNFTQSQEFKLSLNILGVASGKLDTKIGVNTSLSKDSTWGYSIFNNVEGGKQTNGKILTYIPTELTDANDLPWTSKKMKERGFKPWVVTYTVANPFSKIKS